MIIAQITDFHTRANNDDPKGFNSNASLARVIQSINSRETLPDLVLVTGDLVHRASVDEYKNTRSLLDELRAPYYIIPGNHDERAPLRRVFADHEYLLQSEFMQYTIDHLPVQLIGLDTLVEGEGNGALCEERLDWLEATLTSNANKPALVFMHHPPFRGFFRDYRDGETHGGEMLQKILDDSGRVHRVISGHIHRVISSMFGATMVTVAPSTAFAFELVGRGGPPFKRSDEPPGYQLHMWREPGGIVTHTVLVPEAAEAAREKPVETAIV
jgi:3',5'-cyclic AMP phosphodiesterase CpdA